MKINNEQGRTTVGAVPLSVGAALDQQVLDTLHATLAGEGKGPLVSFCNPGSHVLIAENQTLASDLRELDYVLADGTGMVLAARMLGAISERYSFDTTSLAPRVLSVAREHGAPVALVGGREGVAARAAEVLARSYGPIDVVLCRDGFGAVETIVEEVLDSGSRLVICGMGTGAQERVLVALREAGFDGAGFSCGGYLDQLASGLRYYPPLVDRLELRFLYRLLREPRRLGPRYLIDYPRFLLALLAQLSGVRT